MTYRLVTTDARREEQERALESWLAARTELPELLVNDWDADGVPDVVLGCRTQGLLLVLPASAFGPPARGTMYASFPDDVDGDGCPDLWVGLDGHSLVVRSSDGVVIGSSH